MNGWLGSSSLPHDNHQLFYPYNKVLILGMNTCAHLPALAFGDAQSTLESNITQYSQRIAGVITGLEYYEAIGGSAGFRSKSCAIAINGLRMVANANTPVIAKVGSSKDTTLMVPIVGENLSIVGKKGYEWHANAAALLMPQVARGGHCSVRSNLNIDIDPERMQRTIAIMLKGHADVVIDLGLDRPRGVSLHFGKLSFGRMLHHYCGTINTMLETPEVLNYSGLDEAIYRLLAMMLRPDLFGVEFESREEQRPQQAKVIDRLCEELRASLGQKHTLTALEQRSGYSARALQYAFRKRFGCSPLDWLREQRLQETRRRLQAREFGTLTSLGYEFGFSSASQFTASYKTRFGETPGQTAGFKLGMSDFEESTPAT